MPKSAIREIFEVNVFGQIDLIDKCIPLMMSSDYPKIINCSSVLGFISLPYRGLYSTTKYSIEALIDALRRKNYDSKIKFEKTKGKAQNNYANQNCSNHD